MARFFIALILSVVAATVLLTLAGMADGACHCMNSMFTLFPYGSIVTMRTSWESTGLILTFIQIPLYVTLLMILKGTRLGVAAFLVIVGIHALVAEVGLRSYKASRLSNHSDAVQHALGADSP